MIIPDFKVAFSRGSGLAYIAEKLDCESDIELIVTAINDLKSRVAELEPFRTAFAEWHDKTAWVQDDKRFNVLKPWGKHRADVLREYVEHLERRIAELEAREVELPGRIADIDLRSPLEVEYMYRYKTKSMLRAAGIRVKN